MQLLVGDSITDAGHHFTSDGLGNGFVRLLSQQLPGHAITNRVKDGFTVRRTAQMLAQDPAPALLIWQLSSWGSTMFPFSFLPDNPQRFCLRLRICPEGTRFLQNCDHGRTFSF